MQEKYGGDNGAGGNPRRGRPPNSDGRATRDHLLDTALRLFARQGYAATTVRQVATEVGVRDSAIYAHFAGKQAMYDALFAEAGPVSPELLDLDIDALTEAGPNRAVTELVERAFTAWSTYRACLFFELLVQHNVGSAGIDNLLTGIETTRDRLAAPFRRWQEAGQVRADLKPRQLVWELFAPIQVPRVLYLRGDVSDSDVAAARSMVDGHLDFFLTTVLTSERNE